MVMEPVDAKLDTLRRLEAEGGIDDLSIHAWSAKVSLSSDGESMASEVFEEIDEWARWNGVSVRPPFEVSTTTSAYTDRTDTILRTPVICLVVSVDDEIAGVFPHTYGETHYTVAEGIAALRTGDLVVDVADERAERTGCPNCEGDLVNVQGIVSCADCRWTERDEPEPEPEPTRPRLRPAPAGRTSRQRGGRRSVSVSRTGD